MENASKALIIAGAILLSILIISLGIMVYNNAQDSVGNANLDQQEIAAFNAQFTPYQGTSVSASQVNSLIQQVLAANQAEQNKGTGITVSITYPPSILPTGSLGNATINNTSGPSISGASSSVATGKTYKVVFEYSDSLVSKITVTQN